MAKKFAPLAVGEMPGLGSAGTRGMSTAVRRWLDRLFRNRIIRTSARFAREKDDVPADPLLAFGAEHGPAAALPRAGWSHRLTWRTPHVGRWVTIAAGVIVTIALSGGAFTTGRVRSSKPSPTVPGKLTLETRPAGVEVAVDGEARGRTPLTVTLPPGPHQVGLTRGTDVRSVPVTLGSGADVTHYFEFTTPEPAVIRLGKISVVTDPPGARVHIDGQAWGHSPVMASDLSASNHKVVVASDTGSAERIVSVENNATTSVVFSLPKVATPVVGWLALTAPFDVQIREAENVVATGRSAKIMLTAGDHAITLSNEALRYHDTRVIQVAAGKTTTFRVDPPKVAISANARPWADVSIDGTNIGQTPISNVFVSIGEHDVIFRHPQLGERQQTMVVTMGGANRIAVDLRK